MCVYVCVSLFIKKLLFSHKLFGVDLRVLCGPRRLSMLDFGRMDGMSISYHIISYCTRFLAYVCIILNVTLLDERQ